MCVCVCVGEHSMCVCMNVWEEAMNLYPSWPDIFFCRFHCLSQILVVGNEDMTGSLRIPNHCTHCCWEGRRGL